MEFGSDVQRTCYEKAVGWARELFGEQAITPEELPGFAVSIGSAMALATVRPWADDDATIVVRAYVIRGAEMTAELTHFLLRKNDDMRFGAFGLDTDDDIFFEHTIVGSTCDKKELKASVLAVLSTADQMDDEIMSRWGGKRARD